MNVEIELSDQQLQEIARRAAALLPAPSPWMGTDTAAAYIDGKVGRIHDLVALGKLNPRRDGRRLLFHRDDLDAYLEGS